jgi:hypothetical protein
MGTVYTISLFGAHMKAIGISATMMIPSKLCNGVSPETFQYRKIMMVTA